MWDFTNQSLVPFLSIIIDSVSNGVKIAISPRNFAEIAGEKYFVRNLFAITSHVAIVFLGKESNHVFALSLREKGKDFSFITSIDTSLILCYYIFRENSDLSLIHI